jgi:transposase InsO family protein
MVKLQTKELRKGRATAETLRKLPNNVRVTACSTIHAILDRHGLVARQRRSRTKTEGTSLSQGLTPNALWCTDYKGEFMLGDKRYCYPLTVSDHASRYLLICEGMESVKEQAALTAFASKSRASVFWPEAGKIGSDAAGGNANSRGNRCASG